MTYSENQLDDKMKKYLSFGGGFFIEAGANDGLRQSNTLLYEREMGWRGLLVEPNETLIESIKNNRPNCVVENCALVSFDYRSKHVVWSDGPCLLGNKDSLCGMTIDPDGISPGAIPDMTCRSEYEGKRQVPTHTITSLLKKHNITEVDFFSLDVEGYEYSVLDGLDFSYLRPTYILVEVNENFDRMKTYMEEKEYTFLEQLSCHDYLFKDGK